MYAQTQIPSAAFLAERSPGDCIDLDRYPIDDLDSGAGRALIERCRGDLEATGACELPGFIAADVLPRVIAESQAVLPRAHAFRGPITPYLEMPDMRLPPDHVRRQFGRSIWCRPITCCGASTSGSR
jgi:hypothetical protein